ncbi:hypothetical protein Y09_2975 [Brachybacterium sp. SW0106-09]|nr:hypothetical protein Y09_2975 [Brachybacterium sp. SW0106-09]
MRRWRSRAYMGTCFVGGRAARAPWCESRVPENHRKQQWDQLGTCGPVAQGGSPGSAP